MIQLAAYNGTPAAARTERVSLLLSDALAVPESDVRIFGHLQSYPRRRPGVATAANVTTARDRVRQVAAELRKLWRSAVSQKK